MNDYMGNNIIYTGGKSMKRTNKYEHKNRGKKNATEKVVSP